MHDESVRVTRARWLLAVLGYVLVMPPIGFYAGLSAGIGHGSRIPFVVWMALTAPTSLIGFGAHLLMMGERTSVWADVLYVCLVPLANVGVLWIAVRLRDVRKDRWTRKN